MERSLLMLPSRRLGVYVMLVSTLEIKTSSGRGAECVSL